MNIFPFPVKLFPQMQKIKTTQTQKTSVFQEYREATQTFHKTPELINDKS